MTRVYFEIKPGTEIACGWYLEVLPGPSFGDGGNIIAMVMRDPPDPWRLQIRTRMYLDDRLDDSKDERRLYSVTADPSENPDDAKTRLVDKAMTMMFMLQDQSDGRLTLINDHRDTEHFFEIWRAQPWTHSRVEEVPPKES
jgi:hypothetical protein